MTICPEAKNRLLKRIERGDTLEEIGEEICSGVKDTKGKAIRLIKNFLGEQYLIDNAEKLGFYGVTQLKRSMEKKKIMEDMEVKKIGVTPDGKRIIDEKKEFVSKVNLLFEIIYLKETNGEFGDITELLLSAFNKLKDYVDDAITELEQESKSSQECKIAEADQNGNPSQPQTITTEIKLAS